MPHLPAARADFDLRLVRYFTVVAEHGNFRRAADALHLAQPSLSRQIQRLEDRLGVRLLDRSRQGSRLTEAGRTFLPQAQALLRFAEQTAATTRAAARPDDITVGYTGDLIVTALVHDLRKQNPGAGVGTQHLGFGEVRAALLEHRVDVVLAREPFSADQLTVTLRCEEPRVLVLPKSHRLAGRPSVTLDDFADETLVRYADPVYDAFWSLNPRPDGRPAPDGPIVTTTQDKFELVADGQALTLAPDSGTLRALRPDLTTVPVTGIPPCRIVLATRATDRRRLGDNPPVAAVHEERAPGGSGRRFFRG